MLRGLDYLNVIKITTLTSIDIYFINENKFLVGCRKNNPAKDYLFTPGCRTFKGETIREGLERVALKELGLKIDPDKCKLVGIYDHIYKNNFMNNNFGTHYVNSAFVYLISNDEIKKIRCDDQHEDLFMVDFNDALDPKSKYNDKIHENVKITLRDIIKKNIIQL